MRDAERLEQMREEARRRDETARIREQDRDRLAGEVRRRFDQAVEAAQRARAAAGSDAATPRRARPRRAAGCGPVRSRVTGRPPTAGSRTCRGPGARRRRSPTARPGPSGQLERLLAEAAERQRALEAARAEEDRLTAEIQAAAERLAAAEQAAGRASRATWPAPTGPTSPGSTELRVADPDELIDALAGVGGDRGRRQPGGRRRRRRGPRGGRRARPSGGGAVGRAATPHAERARRAGGGDRAAAGGRPRRPASAAHQGTRRPRRAARARRCGR